MSSLKQDFSQNLNSQLDVAILNSRGVTSSPPQTAISRYNNIGGSPSYCATTAKKSLFGKTITIYHRDILSNLVFSVLRIRNFTLVRHDIQNDLQISHPLDFNLPTSIRGILDTGRIASTLLPNISIRFSSFLSELRYPFRSFHTAGNDAYFTLRVQSFLA